ncbi:hypothetical protein EHS25_002996 [Saitozyma podzolica]|uniref:Uncharacterized protein n=1 Tax=Saitozyma podzolica TaxID=1890683 RepID=A0A427YCF4_9TREE|nr:hypothetical protein EHS25_002996 [Saitozyma podzolica]
MGDSARDRYFWSPEHDLTIQDFIKKTRPSIVTDDVAPWIWVQGSDAPKKDPEVDGAKGGVIQEARKIVDRLTKRMAEIEDDDDIPVRASKGKKSKKVVREEAHENAKEELHELSVISTWTVGKWLLFPQRISVDGMWSALAQSVADGPLRDAGVFLAKVAPTPAGQAEGEQRPHVICLYIPDVYDLKVVRKVLETLLGKHGLEPSAVKSDLYTLAGIDSNHPSKLRSTIWRPYEVITGGKDAVEKLKAQYKPQKGADGKKQVGQDGFIDSDSEDEKISRMNKRKARVTGADSSAKSSSTQTKEEKRSVTTDEQEQAAPRMKKHKAASAA